MGRTTADSGASLFQLRLTSPMLIFDVMSSNTPADVPPSTAVSRAAAVAPAGLVVSPSAISETTASPSLQTVDEVNPAELTVSND